MVERMEAIAAGGRAAQREIDDEAAEPDTEEAGKEGGAPLPKSRRITNKRPSAAGMPVDHKAKPVAKVAKPVEKVAKPVKLLLGCGRCRGFAFAWCMN